MPTRRRSPATSGLQRVENIMIATPQASLEAAAEVARKAGVTPVILGDSIEGESRDVALVHAGIARQCALRGQPERPPCVLISGGETTITLEGQRQRRPQHRVPAGARHRARRQAEYLCARRRHRRRRRLRGQCRRVDLSRYADARRQGRDQRQGDARRQRSLDLLQRDRRSVGDRADAHQCQRLPRRADREDARSRGAA